MGARDFITNHFGSIEKYNDFIWNKWRSAQQLNKEDITEIRKVYDKITKFVPLASLGEIKELHTVPKDFNLMENITTCWDNKEMRNCYFDLFYMNYLNPYSNSSVKEFENWMEEKELEEE